MTCQHGTGPQPVPKPFADDDELRQFLGLPDTPRGRALVESLTAEERQQYAEMRGLWESISAGIIPAGVIACDRKRRKRK